LLAALVRPRGDDAAPTRYRRPAFYALSMLAYAAAMFGLMSLWVVLSEQTADWPHKATLGVLLFVGLLGALLFSAHRVRYAAALAILCVSFMVAQSWFGTQKSTLYAERNFFGLSRVQVDSTYNARVYKHGTTLHGIQSLQDEQRLGIASYYHPIGDIIMHLPGDAATAPVAVGGMGVGTIACWGKPNQRMDFYEIDPVAERIALDENMFTYLSDCPPTVNVIIGDARLKLEQAEDAQYGLIVMDAYSSDSLPIHLITQEAVAMYASKLRDDGALAFNITNRHLHLAPIVASIADSLELSAWHKRDIVPEGDKSSLRFSSHWIVLAKDPATLAPLEEAPMSWQPLHGDGRTPWSDHYSNILEAL